MRRGFEIISGSEIPKLATNGDWDVVEMATCSVPTVYRGILDQACFSPLVWLKMHHEVQLLTPGENGEGHNAFSTKRSGWESGYKQEKKLLETASFDPEGLEGEPSIEAESWHARWR